MLANFLHARRYEYGNHDTSHVGHFLRTIVQLPVVLESVHGEGKDQFPIFGGRLYARAVLQVFGACQSCSRKQNRVAAYEADPLPVFVEREHLIVIFFHCQAFTLPFPTE